MNESAHQVARLDLSVINETDNTTNSLYFSINNDTLTDKMNVSLEPIQSSLDKTLTAHCEVMDGKQKTPTPDECILAMRFKSLGHDHLCSTPNQKWKLGAENEVGSEEQTLSMNKSIFRTEDQILPLLEVMNKIERNMVSVKSAKKENCTSNKENRGNTDAAFGREESETICATLPQNPQIAQTSKLRPNNSGTEQRPTTFKFNKPDLQVPKATRMSHIPLGANKPFKMPRYSVARPSLARESKRPHARQSVVPGPGAKVNIAPKPVPIEAATTVPTEFPCNTCKKSFRLRSTLVTHQRRMHKSGNIQGAYALKSSHVCTYCQKGFEKEIGLRNHIERYCTKVPVAERRRMNGVASGVSNMGLSGTVAKSESVSARNVPEVAQKPSKSGLIKSPRKSVFKSIRKSHLEK